MQVSVRRITRAREVIGRSNGNAPSTCDPTPPAPANPTFGKTFTYQNGLQLTVGPPKAFTPSPNRLGPHFPAYVRFRVTIVNGTTKNYDASIFNATVQSTNIEGEFVADSAQGLTGSPSTVLLPGREAVFDIAYGVNDPKDIVMEVRAGFEYESVVYVT